MLPTLGSKEAIFHLAQVVGGDFVAVTTPGYPVAERGAAFAGKQVLELELAPERGFLPDLDAVDAATWDRTAILWLNYPNNPTAATAPLELYERAGADRAGRTTSWSPPTRRTRRSTSARCRRSRRSRSPTAATSSRFNTLSKRSSMPGYRSGFVAGDPR